MDITKGGTDDKLTRIKDRVLERIAKEEKKEEPEEEK